MNENGSLLLFPDPLWTPEMVSGAAFLYFDGPLLIPIPSASSIGMLGVGPATLAEMVEKKRPRWHKDFMSMYQLHAAGSQTSAKTMDLLMPLRGDCFKWIQLAYPHTTDWMNESEELLQATGLQPEEFGGMMNPLTAADSLTKHVLFEMYIATIHPGEDGLALGKDLAERTKSGDPIPAEFGVDPTPLYAYCDEFFSSAPFANLLFRAYGLRLLVLQRTKGMGGIFLSDPRVIGLLSQLPVEQQDSDTVSIDDDVVAWELFRQLVSTVIDPLNEGRVELIAKFRAQRADEIGRLKRKCLSLTGKLRDLPTPTELEKQVSRLIEAEVKDELADLLRLDRSSSQEFMDSLFSDEKTWIAFAAILAAILGGHTILTAASAVGALSNVGAKAIKSAAKRRTKLKASPYSLLYNFQHMAPKQRDGAEQQHPSDA